MERDTRDKVDKVLKGLLIRNDLEVAVNLLLDGGKKKKESRPLKFKINGAQLILPGSWSWDQLDGLTTCLSEARKKAQKLGVDLSVLPRLIVS